MLYFYIIFFSDNKESDAYISYSHDSEADFVIAAEIVNFLEERGYKVILRDRDHKVGAGRFL